MNFQVVVLCKKGHSYSVTINESIIESVGVGSMKSARQSDCWSSERACVSAADGAPINRTHIIANHVASTVDNSSTTSRLGSRNLSPRFDDGENLHAYISVDNRTIPINRDLVSNFRADPVTATFVLVQVGLAILRSLFF